MENSARIESQSRERAIFSPELNLSL